MIETYLTGSINQSLERIKQLRQIVQGQYPREYDGLRQICLTQLDSAQNMLQQLAQETLIDTSLQTPRRIREFKRIVECLYTVEGIGVFALNRTSDEDHFLNCLITKVCQEINYPLVPPVISQMSQDYFHTYPEFNLLCLPLIESRFLLHLPDIYHELCHPFHRSQNSDLPQLEPYFTSYKNSLFTMVQFFQEQATVAERIRKPEGKRLQLQLWQTCWVKYWMEEMFCDLFGVFSAGPAFVWSHYHLCVKRGRDPFETPFMFSITHPADDARMRAMLKMLLLLGKYDSEVKSIKEAWQDFVGLMEYHAEPEYLQCYSDEMISEIVKNAKNGIEGAGIIVSSKQTNASIIGQLNTAWKEFWTNPHRYQSSEKKRLAELREHIGK